MIKVKDGYTKLINTSYTGDISQVLLSNGGTIGYDVSTNTILATIGSNVASADKLKNKVKIWGQDFDGTNNVNGSLVLNNNASIVWKDTGGTDRNAISLSNSNNFHIGYGVARAGYNTYLDGNKITFRYGTTPSDGMVLSSNGNVGIGTTNPSTKLHVSGTAYASKFLMSGTTGTITGIARSWTDTYNDADSNARPWCGLSVVPGQQTYEEMTLANYYGMLFKTGGSGFPYIFMGGDVGIGTTSPSAKLHVEGVTYATNFISGDGVNDFSAGTVKLDTLNIPTSSGGTTFGPGSDGQVLKSNGTTVYWASDKNTNSWRAIQVNGTQIAGTGTSTYALNFVSGTGITVEGVPGSSSAANGITITNAGVRSVTIGTGDNANKVVVDTNGTPAYLTIPYATTASQLSNTYVSDPNKAASGQYLKWYSQVSQASGYAGTNYGFPVSNNANGILWLGTHSGPYGGQLGVSSNGRLYYRFITNNAFPTTANGGSWSKIAWTSDIPTKTSQLTNDSGFLTAHQSLANYVTLNSAQTISGVKTFSTQQKFTVAQGTAPFTVTSTTKVANLNADLLDNHNASEFPLLNGIKSGTWNWNDVLRAGYYKIQAGTITNHPSGIYQYGMAAVLTTENHADGENRELQLYYPHNQTNSIAIWGRMHNSSTQGNGWGPWWGIPNTEGVKQIIGTYYWANVKVSSTSSTTTSPTFANTTVNGVLAVNGSNAYLLVINSSHATENGLVIRMGGTNKTWVGYTTGTGSYLYNYTGLHKIGVNDSGVGFIDSNTILHTGNYTSYTDGRYVNVTGDTMSGTLIFSGISTGNWTEGIRINDSTNGWTSLTMGGTATSGTGAKIWSLHTYDGNFYISKNGSSAGDQTLQNVGNHWYINTTTGGDTLNVGGWIATVGNTGWFSTTHKGGWYMSDANWIRNYNSKPLCIDIGTNNTYGIGAHRLAAYFYGSGHVSILLSNNACGWGICSNSDTNLYFGYRPSSSASTATNDSYPSYLTKAGHWYATHYYESSDQRLKENIQAILNKDNIPQIKEFDWKESGEHSYGLIAQELEEQGYSELVSIKDDGYKTVNYSAALSLIVGKLQVKIRELEKEIEELKNK